MRETGHGYPSIDSLKAIAAFFDITIDELLSNRELIGIAEKDTSQKTQQLRDLAFGLIDLAVGMLLFIPLFGQPEGDRIRQVSLLSLHGIPLSIKAAYLVVILSAAACGIATLALQGCSSPVWTRSKTVLSMSLTAASTAAFIICLEPYAAFFAFILTIIKGILLLKRP